MKRPMLTTIALGAVMLSTAAYAEEAPGSVVELANTTLAAMGTDPAIVKAVRDQNSLKRSLADIKKMDEQWKSTPGIADFMKDYLENDCALMLRDMQNSTPYYAEIFVMDNQGANVCQTDKTSDYWQGDEAKFEKSYAGGKGRVFVDEVEFDDSSQAYLVQVSVPVMDGGKAIGAISFGIDLDRIE